jgi:hypothetical protein
MTHRGRHRSHARFRIAAARSKRDAADSAHATV